MFEFEAGPKKTIHVHQQKIRAGQPAIIVRTSKDGSPRHYRRVEVDGPLVLMQPEKPNSCGARVWLETNARVLAWEG